METQTGAHTTDVLIVGGGPTGLTLACELQRRGIRFRLIEKNSEFPVTSRALAIHPRTLEVFDMMGVVDAILAHTYFVGGLSVREGNRAVLETRMNLPPRPDQHYRRAAGQNQAVTERVLCDYLTRLGGAIEWAHELTALRQEPGGGILASVLHHATGETEEIHAAYLVGCDGAHSAVRHALGIEMEGSTYAEHFALADLEMDADLPGDAGVMWVNPKGLFASVPLPDLKLRRLFVEVTPNAAGKVPEPTLEFFQQALVERAGDTTTRLSNPIWLSIFTLHRRMVRHYHQGNVFLAGDAAHIHSPFGGQGMNTGIQDAFNLAWKLALTVQGKASAHLLDTYEEERRPVAQKVLNQTDTNFKVIFSLNPVFRFLRNHVLFSILNYLTKNPGFLEMAFKRSSELYIHYRESSLAQKETGRRMRGPHPGDRAPDAPLSTAAAKTPARLQEQFRATGFTLLLFQDQLQTGAGKSPFQEIEQLVRDSFPGQIQVCRIVPAQEPLPAADNSGAVLVDADHQAARIYGIQGDTLYLIRPDGYVGFRSSTEDEQAFRQYLASVFR